jgi:hypothetical protein
MEKEKIIFLDFDGVLNTEAHLRSLQKEKVRSRDEFGHKFCPTATDNLAWIIRDTGAKIVVSSTWRASGLAAMREMWKARELPGEITGITPHRYSRLRGEEIEQYLSSFRETQGYFPDYVIIDDDQDMLGVQTENFVQTDYIYGITLNDAWKAIQILNQKTDKDDTAQ